MQTILFIFFSKGTKFKQQGMYRIPRTRVGNPLREITTGNGQEQLQAVRTKRAYAHSHKRQRTLSHFRIRPPKQTRVCLLCFLVIEVSMSNNHSASITPSFSSLKSFKTVKETAQDNQAQFEGIQTKMREIIVKKSHLKQR